LQGNDRIKEDKKPPTDKNSTCANKKIDDSIIPCQDRRTQPVFFMGGEKD